MANMAAGIKETFKVNDYKTLADMAFNIFTRATMDVSKREKGETSEVTGLQFMKELTTMLELVQSMRQVTMPDGTMVEKGTVIVPKSMTDVKTGLPRHECMATLPVTLVTIPPQVENGHLRVKSKALDADVTFEWILKSGKWEMHYLDDLGRTDMVEEEPVFLTPELLSRLKGDLLPDEKTVLPEADIAVGSTVQIFTGPFTDPTLLYHVQTAKVKEITKGADGERQLHFGQIFLAHEVIPLKVPFGQCRWMNPAGSIKYAIFHVKG